MSTAPQHESPIDPAGRLVIAGVVVILVMFLATQLERRPIIVRPEIPIPIPAPVCPDQNKCKRPRCPYSHPGDSRGGTHQDPAGDPVPKS